MAKMKKGTKIFLILAVVIVVVAAALIGLVRVGQSALEAMTTGAASYTALERMDLANTLSVSGNIQSADVKKVYQEANGAGKALQVNVEVGDTVAEGDVPKLKDSLMRFVVTRGDSAELDHSAFLSDLDFIVADFAGLDLKDLDIGEFLTSLLNLARKNDVELPSVVTMFARGMVTLEGLLTEYMPDVNMIQIIQAHIKNEKSTYARVRDMSRDFAASSYRAAKGSLEAAEYLGLASRMLTRGQLKVNTQIMSSDKALRQLGGIIDRMSMAIVIAGLFIGSSVVYYARIEPVVFGIPVIGFMGYVSALVLALMLGRNIWLNSHGGKH